MADDVKQPVAESTVNVPGLQAVPWVAVRLPSGIVVLRHPDELTKIPNAAPVAGAKR